MPIITLEETKAILKITDSTYDQHILSLIPIVQSKIISYCRNYFLDTRVKLEHYKIFFEVSSSGHFIKLPIDFDNSFLNKGFYPDCDIAVIDSLSNDGVYTIDDVQDKAIKIKEAFLKPENAFLEYSSFNPIRVVKVQFPTDLKLDAALIIKNYIEQKSSFVSSESLPGGYSVTYKDPVSLFAPLNRYRKIYL